MLKVIVFQGIQNLPLFAAQARGFYAAVGLEGIALEFTPNSWTLRDGLAEGRYDIAHSAVDNAVAMAVAGRKIAIALGGDNGFNALYAQPNVQSIEGLRGRTVLVDAVDTAFALVLYKILRNHGLERGSYEVRSVGATPLRLQAMKQDKTAAAAILNLPFRIQAERHGLKRMGEAIDEIGPYLSTAGYVMQAWAQENADVLVRYIMAYVLGLRWALDAANKAAAVQLLQAQLDLQPDVAEAAYAIATAASGGLAQDARVDIDGLCNVLALRAEIQNQWNGVPPPAEDFLDLRYHADAIRQLTGRQKA